MIGRWLRLRFSIVSQDHSKSVDVLEGHQILLSPHMPPQYRYYSRIEPPALSASMACLPRLRQTKVGERPTRLDDEAATQERGENTASSSKYRERAQADHPVN